MVRKYKRKREIKWTKDEIDRAVIDCKQGSSIYSVSKSTGIPKTTLNRHLKSPDKDILMGPPTIVTKEEEEVIVETSQLFGEWGFGLTKQENLNVLGEYFNYNKRNQTPLKMEYQELTGGTYS